jgi:allantoate deiminase
VATVGRCAVQPGAANVIPGRVEHPLDVRHARDAARRAAVRRLAAASRSIARRRGLRVAWTVTQDHSAVRCAPVLTSALARSVAAIQGRAPGLVSGAGHDAVVMASLTPVAMLFVRCRDGLSHHPREHVSTADLGVALRVLVDFLGRLAAEESA